MGEGGSRRYEFDKLREREDSMLAAAGFEGIGYDLCMKDGICYGREAALQAAWREIQEPGESPLSSSEPPFSRF